ncbi:DUF6682 family protein [Paraburkholderia sp. BL10I2N1]|uniref:phage adaptor protein n=1 Tax=Paraburkholderia sp. BL10I2N1 TaxID=1938796 RepID=UPI00105C2A7D|nr:DUF6682 family protein [Paraburkholderia sp. BL10I2N1]TDN70413.1 hypothetical protein B0G77_3887 [Paraburkholderia sp. BL10I2N1]
MGTITGTAIINKAATQLLDTANTRWTRTELLGWLNDAQRQVVLMQPNSNSTTVAVRLVAGTRQAIPVDGWLLLDIYRNMGTNGATPGRVVRIVSRQLIDAQMPTWHASAASSTAQNYVYDIQDQTAFYVYPPSDGTGYVEVNYSRVPADLTTEASTIAVNDVLETTLLDYVLFRANSKDAEYAPGFQLAQGYWTAFTAALGAKDKAETTNNVNQTLGPAKGQPEPGATS